MRGRVGDLSGSSGCTARSNAAHSVWLTGNIAIGTTSATASVATNVGTGGRSGYVATIATASVSARAPKVTAMFIVIAPSSKPLWRSTL